mgnify:CR=1 FL=1
MDVVSTCMHTVHVHSWTFSSHKITLWSFLEVLYISGSRGSYTCSPILQNNTQKDFLELKPKMFFYQDHLVKLGLMSIISKIGRAHV